MKRNRCCVCRAYGVKLEPTDLPGDLRCIDTDWCRRRVHAIVGSRELALILSEAR